MYDKMCRQLRAMASTWGISLPREAANAIEELSRAQEQWIEQERNALLKSIPSWIPVTERLPEKRQIVVVIGEKGTWDYGMFNGLSSTDNPEYWNWKKNTLKHVKWWMPKDGALPEPPKEGK